MKPMARFAIDSVFAFLIGLSLSFGLWHWRAIMALAEIRHGEKECVGSITTDGQVWSPAMRVFALEKTVMMLEVELEDVKKQLRERLPVLTTDPSDQD